MAYYLKDLNVLEYRVRAHKYLSEVFMRIGRSDYLVLDQIVSDNSADMEKYNQYIGHMKLIAVYRDPRDVYVTGRLKHENWIPEDPICFVKWYRDSVDPYLAVQHPDFKLIRFEDVVLQYGRVVREVEDFLGLDRIFHVRQRQCFDPAKSVKNIGIYKSWKKASLMDSIQRALPEYCV